MRIFFYIFIPLLVSSTITFGQFEITPLKSDPHRQQSNNIPNTAGSRIAATEGIQAVIQVKDTLKLPFFDDFTSLAAHTDSVRNKPALPFCIYTFGLHGLNNGDKIFILQDPITPFLTGNWYVKKITPFSFELYLTQDLSTPLFGNGTAIPSDNNPVWVRPNSVISPNPDTLKWENKGGVYINNRYCIDPPSYNAATFDGLNANGKAYVNSSTYIVGSADSLISLPIDLSTVQTSSSLVLSFYLQKGGQGDVPDPVDSIYLQLKDNLGIWNNVWSMKGDSNTAKFQAYLISITDPVYFFKGFQFRFLTQGELSGSFDVWNLDYILLDTNRTLADSLQPDVAIQKAPLSILKNYTAMPYKQFFGGNSIDLTDKLSITLNSMDNTFPYEGLGSTSLFLTDEISHTLLSQIPSITTGNVDQLTTKEMEYLMDPSYIPNLGSNLKIKYFARYALDNKLTKGVQYKTNDSISGYTVLNDYYAYDDSTAEWAAGINQSTGKIAAKFLLNVMDTLIGFDIYFTHIYQEHLNTPVDLIVWKSLYPEQEIGRTPIAISYPTMNNKFKRFMLTNDIKDVKDSVFIGFQQAANFYIPIGFDKNTNSTGKMFYNVTGSWVSIKDTGSLMIRPVFRNGKTISGIIQGKQTQDVLDCEVYPNPSTGILNILGEVNHAALTDLSGRLIFEQTFSTTGIHKIMELQNISDGFYLLRLSNNKASAIKKIILVK